jgi:hypothetical protein
MRDCEMPGSRWQNDASLSISERCKGRPEKIGARHARAGPTWWLIVFRISATSSTDPAVVDPVSCRLGA